MCLLLAEPRHFEDRQGIAGHFVMHDVGVSLLRFHFGIVGRLRDGEHIEEMVRQRPVVD